MPGGETPASAAGCGYSSAIRTWLASAWAVEAGLSAREVEVLQLPAAGLSNAEIAARLFLGPRTIKSHLASIYGKIGVDNRVATRYPVERGLA